MKLTWKKVGWFAEESSARYSTTLPNGDSVFIAQCSYSKEWQVMIWKKADGTERTEAQDFDWFPRKKDLQKMISEYPLYPAPANCVQASQLSKLRMVAGNETKFSRVIHEGVVKEWVGIGWIKLEKATEFELQNLPIVI